MSPEDVAEMIRRIVDHAPPLNEHQRSRLGALLNPGISRRRKHATERREAA